MKFINLPDQSHDTKVIAATPHALIQSPGSGGCKIGAPIDLIKSLSAKGLLMRQMTDKQVAKWERIRARGRKRFIVRWGALGFGVTAVVVSLIVTCGSGASLWVWLANSLLMVPLGGYLFGAWLWQSFEAAYAKSTTRQGTK